VTFHILTIFPGFFTGPLDHGVVPRARRDGLLDIKVHDLRNWTHDRHRTVDDRPFGGGAGMLLKCEPIFDAVEKILPGRQQGDPDRRVILLSAQGHKFDQARALGYSDLKEILLICGRYEGVDERVAQHLADDEISIGDYVLSGGEHGACVILDAVARLNEGVLGNRESSVNESFRDPALLDCPQYTRPEVFRGWPTPDVLLSGNHAQIRAWREQAAREKTARLRPDLLKS
jgi:tRNA (guanine37-N1)-methyltransferase